MPEKLRRGLQALLLVGTPLAIAAWLLFPQSRPWTWHYHQPQSRGHLVYDRHFHLYVDPDTGQLYDPVTGKKLEDDDPRFNSGKMFDEIKRDTDREMREHPEKFRPPHYR